MRLIVVGDLHAQEAKLWHVLAEAGVASEDRQPTPSLLDGEARVVLLGDLVHAKHRSHYGDLAEVGLYDEFDPMHLRRAERAQEAFLRRVRTFQESVPEESFVILLGNHDFNAVTPEQGPLRSDDLTHLEWKPGYGNALPDELHEWIAAWPREVEVEGIHLAHVGPREEHNIFDTDFYLQNRRQWIMDDRDHLADTPYRLGVYGHTPVRGGLNLASQGRALLLDTNGYADEYAWLEVRFSEDDYRLRLRGLVFDERIPR